MAQDLRKNPDKMVRLERAALAMFSNFGICQRLIIGMLEILMRPLVRVFQVKPLPDLHSARKIMVLEPGHLGDVVLLTPFLQSLRARFPNSYIAILGRPNLKSILDVQSLVDELIPIEIPWTAGLPRWRVYNPFSIRLHKFMRDLLRLRRRGFDLAFVAGWGDIRHNFALFVSGARRRVAYGFAGGRMFLTDAVQPDLSRIHHSDLSLRLLEHLEIPTLPATKLLPLDQQDADFGQEFLRRHGIGVGDLVVGIHPRAGAVLKEWGEDCFQHVAERIIAQFGAKVIWFLDPEEPDGGLVGGNKDIVQATLPLRQFLALLSSCDVLVCNDSGPMHMAAGLGTRVVAIFGPELPDWYGPLGAGHKIVTKRAMWCRPCWRECRFDQPYCLRLISVEEVMQAVTEALIGLPRPVVLKNEVRDAAH